MQNVNIVLGRFQPFTLGHLACVDQAFKDTGLETVLAIIETPKEKRDAKHPFTTEEILPVIDKMIKDNTHIIDYIIVKNADIEKIANALHDKDYELAAWTCGTDRYPAYSAQCKRYWEKVGLPAEPRCIEVKRGDDDVSATAMRRALRDDDKAGYMKLMPRQWHKEFARLKGIIDTVDEDAGNHVRHRLRSLYEYIAETMGL